MSRMRKKSWARDQEERRERVFDARHEAQRLRAKRAEAWRLHNEGLAARPAVTT